MKIRTGFVSNSSSSSFVVKLRNTKDKTDRQLLSAKDEKKLKKYGFSVTVENDPRMLLRHFNNDVEKESPRDIEDTSNILFDGALSLGLDVLCNQEDVIRFLLENDIEFTASIHYGDSFMFHRKGEKWFYELDDNVELLFDSQRPYGEPYKDPSIRRMSVKEFLSNERRQGPIKGPTI